MTEAVLIFKVLSRLKEVILGTEQISAQARNFHPKSLSAKKQQSSLPGVKLLLKSRLQNTVIFDSVNNTQLCF